MLSASHVITLLMTPLVVANERPVIGILTQEFGQNYVYPGYSSFIAASYVKAVEQSGARVVPIFINRTEQYYKDVLSSINGVVFPGGSVSMLNVGGNADAGRFVVQHAKQINDEKISFPILGVCMGFELLIFLEVNSYKVLSQCEVMDINLPLEFTEDWQESRLYGTAPRDIIDILSSENVTFNHHRKCVTEELLNQHNLTDQWKVLSTNTVDLNGTVEFVSSAESHNYPFSGVIFHPEKIAYEWVEGHNIPHSKNAVLAARHFYDWLVEEAKKNNHSFNSVEEEDNALIYNYNVTYVNGYFEQLYLFE